VPPGFVVKTGAFEKFIDALERVAPVRSRVEALNADDLDAVTACSKELRARVEGAELPREVLDEISAAHVELCGQGGGTPKPSGQALFGLGLAPLTDDLRSKYNLDPKTKGVLVTEVDPASPAAEKGIKAGDVIVEIAQEPVNTVDDVAKGIDKVKNAGSKAVLLRLEGGKGDMRFVALPVR